MGGHGKEDKIKWRRVGQGVDLKETHELSPGVGSERRRDLADRSVGNDGRKSSDMSMHA